jgi:phenylalanyl-tRNA synthetase beta chain
MKLSMNWLKDYIDIDLSAEQLAEKLTSVGFEVESIEHQGLGMDKAVVGHILQITKHPNADRLVVCKVDIGSKIIQIITAATNVHEGDLVPVALDGATLPNGVLINTTQMRGVTSEGMFCSGAEFKIDDSVYPGAEVDGILILHGDYRLGETIAEVLGMNDSILDVNVLSNRPDCNSVIGLAREISAVLHIEMKAQKSTYKVDGFKTNINVEIENDCGCLEYNARLVKNIKIMESPKYIQDRLRAVGIRPINNIVDITNYVLIDCGQPMHAFDLKTISGDKIIARRAKDGEKILALNDKEYVLSNNDIVIANTNEPMAIAGVMGGKNYSISNDTKDIVFESATFKRELIRKTSRRLGLRSDSSARYERGVDLGSPVIGLNKALSMIEEEKCGEISSNSVSINTEKYSDKKLCVSVKKINELLGINLDGQRMKDILNSLKIDTTLSEDTLTLNVPIFRGDIENISDVAEEIIREYGFTNVGKTLFDKMKFVSGEENVVLSNERSLKLLLSTMGLNEIVTYSLINKNQFDLLNIDKDSKFRNVIKLRNPLNEDLEVLRTTLISNALNVVLLNNNRSNKNLKLFEIGRKYIKVSEDDTVLPKEINCLSITMTGENASYYKIKFFLDTIAKIYNKSFDYEEETTLPFMNKFASAKVVCDGNNIGYIGEVHPTIINNYGISEKVVYAEIELNNILNKDVTFNQVKQLPKYQGVERDLCFVVPLEMQYKTLYDEITKSAGKFCESVNLFDTYVGEQVPTGFKSLSFKIKLQKFDNTFTDEEVEKIISKILKTLQYKFGIELRKD